MKKISAILIIALALALCPAASAKGTTYYVASSVTGSGLSEDDPMSFEAINAKILRPGDTVLFRRGDVFWGCYQPEGDYSGDTARITISAYGEGELPRISNAKIISKPFEKSGGFYRYNISKTGDYGGVQSEDTNVGFIEDGEGKKWGRRMENAAACTKQYDFYISGGYIYIKTDKEPYSVIGEMILPVWGSLLKVHSYVTVENLHLQYTSSHGIDRARLNPHDVIIRDCVIEDIGGGRLDWSYFLKCGNGIEFYDDAYNIKVERNIIRRTYDCAFTLQGAGTFKNITFRNNVIANCTQGVELWTNENESGGIIDSKIYANTFVNQGGWGALSRPDAPYGGTGQFTTTDILIYQMYGANQEISIYDNIFYNSSDNFTTTFSVGDIGEKFYDNAEIDSNAYYKVSENSVVNSYGDNGVARSQNFAEFKARGFEQNGALFKAEHLNFEALAQSSSDYNEIVSAEPARINEFVAGDVTGDKIVSSADLLLLKRYNLGLAEFSKAQTEAAKLSGIEISSADSLALKKIILGVL